MPISSTHLKIVRPADDATRAIVETPEHEVIDLEGCSPEEVEAKLHDFAAWAS